jgi:DNA-binding LacI/PurR family transcriptional regulator
LLPTLDIPVVYSYCYSSKPASYRTQNISYDDHQGAMLAIEHIICEGHTKIAIIGGMINSHATHHRMIGYRATLMRHGLPIYDEYLVF